MLLFLAPAGIRAFSSPPRCPLILLLLVSFLFAASPAPIIPPAASPAAMSSTIPSDLLRTGEVLVRTVATEGTIPPAYVIRTADGKVIISWKGARTVPYDAIAIKPETGEELIKFKEGSLLFRVIRSGEPVFTVQVIDRGEFGTAYLMVNEGQSHLWLIVDGEEILCREVQGTPMFLALLPAKHLMVFFTIGENGAQVDTWVQTY